MKSMNSKDFWILQLWELLVSVLRGEHLFEKNRSETTCVSTNRTTGFSNYTRLDLYFHFGIPSCIVFKSLSGPGTGPSKLVPKIDGILQYENRWYSAVCTRQ